MDKYEILKSKIEGLFGKATDAETIKEAAVVAADIDALKSENEALAKSKGDLLNDYKKLVLTASFKPADTENVSGSARPAAKTFEEALRDFAKNSQK